MPPDAAKLAAYAVPTVPFGADAVVTIRGAGAMVRLKDFDAPAAAPSLAAPAASFTVAFTVNLAAAVGVPLMVPSAVAVTPAGRPVTVQAYGDRKSTRLNSSH